MRIPECTVKIKKLSPDAQLPKRSLEHDVGYDLATPREVTLYDGEPQLISLGFATEIPTNYYLEEHSRSSTFLKYCIDIRVGIIDPDYRGEWMLAACYRRKSIHEPMRIVIPEKTRLGQVILRERLSCEWKEVDELSDTTRSIGGFGSTGSN